MNFDRAIEFLFQPGIEGKTSMDPNDDGNWTGGKVGVGEMTGTHWGIAASSGLPRPANEAEARQLFKVHYWDKFKCADLPHPIDFLYFDARVNQYSIAAEMLQQAIVTCGESIKVDGVVGPKTIAAAFRVSPWALVAEFVGRRNMAYAMHQKAKQNPGWFRRTPKALLWAVAVAS